MIEPRPAQSGITERSQNEIAQAILDLCPAAEPLVEEWFAVLVRVHQTMREDAAREREALERVEYVTRPDTYSNPLMARLEAHRISWTALHHNGTVSR